MSKPVWVVYWKFRPTIPPPPERIGIITARSISSPSAKPAGGLIFGRIKAPPPPPPPPLPLPPVPVIPPMGSEAGSPGKELRLYEQSSPPKGPIVGSSTQAGVVTQSSPLGSVRFRGSLRT